MSGKRNAIDQESSDGTRRSKRLKPSPVAAAIVPEPSPLQLVVASLLEEIEKMPSNLIAVGLTGVLKDAANEDRLARPDIYENTLEYIDSQITTLTEATENGQIEAKYTLLAKRVVIKLKKLNELLTPDHEAMPVPSVFGKHWAEAQEGPNAILCLRPPHRQGLPLITLHEAFLCFVNESKKPLSATDVDALRAAHRLSTAMAKSYESEAERRDAFNTMLDPFILREDWLPELVLGEKPGMSGRLDGALKDYPLLREDNGESGSNGDPYMQIARGFQAFVTWRESQGSPHGKPGVAKFLLILSGPFLMIAGGFYDGKRTIVEPLRYLVALKKALLLTRVPSEAVVAATPCIYSSVASSDETEIPISFVEPLPRLGSLIFSAKATIESKTERCLVKLVYGRYGEEVHRLLARDGLAPGLIGVRTKEGAPTAIAMEYLKPYSRGSEGWATLFSFAKKLRAPDVQKGLAIAVHGIVRKLEQANLVHGDLRANNLMVHVNADGTVLDGEKVRVKAIDFDWSGQSGEPKYPLWRNSDISWPADIGEAVKVGDDQALVKSWWGGMFPQQEYPPVG